MIDHIDVRLQHHRFAAPFAMPSVAAAEEKELSTSRYRTSVCAVPVGRAPPLVPVATEAVAP